jgi:hypothetical protein
LRHNSDGGEEQEDDLEEEEKYVEARFAISSACLCKNGREVGRTDSDPPFVLKRRETRCAAHCQECEERLCRMEGDFDAGCWGCVVRPWVAHFCGGGPGKDVEEDMVVCFVECRSTC